MTDSKWNSEEIQEYLKHFGKYDKDFLINEILYYLHALVKQQETYQEDTKDASP